MMDAAGRLCADPCLSVKGVSKASRNFVQSKGTKDLHALLESQLGTPVSWKVATQPDWLFKVAPLFLQLAELCPNTVLLSSKVALAIQALQKEECITNTSCKLDQDFWDLGDFTIRVLFSHFREIKRQTQTYNRIMRKCSARQWNAIEGVLNKIVIPDAPTRNLKPPESWGPLLDEIEVKCSPIDIFKKYSSGRGS